MQLVIRAIRCPPPDDPRTISARFGVNGGRIGRYYACALALRDPEHFISREHLEVRFRHGRFALQVISQINGATVNDVALGPGGTVELSDGDRIRLGRYEFVAELSDLAAATLPKSVGADASLPDAGGFNPAETLPEPALASPEKAAAAGESPVTSSDVIRALAEGLGLAPEALDVGRPLETACLAGDLLRRTLAGLHLIVQARDESADLRPPEERATLVGQVFNPLEHVASTEEALRALLDLRRHPEGSAQVREAVEAAMMQLVTNLAGRLPYRPGEPPRRD